MSNPTPSSPGQRHRVVIASGSGGGDETELEQLRAIADFDVNSRTWRTSLSTYLDDSDLARLQALFRIASKFGARVRIEPLEADS